MVKNDDLEMEERLLKGGDVSLMVYILHISKRKRSYCLLGLLNLV